MARFDDVDLSSVGYFIPRGPLPDGEYFVRVVDSLIRDYYGEKQLSITLEVQRGEYSGRKLWENLRLWHSDKTHRLRDTVRLKTIARACGHPNPDMMKDSVELHGRTMYVTVRSVERNEKVYQNIENYRLPPEDERSEATTNPARVTPVPSNVFNSEGFDVAGDDEDKAPWDEPDPVIVRKNDKKPAAPWEAWE